MLAQHDRIAIALILAARPLAAQSTADIEALRRAGNPSAAAEQAESRLLADADDAELRLIAARARMDLEQHDVARGHLDRLIRGDGPAWARAWAFVHRGQLDFADGRYDSAHIRLSAAVELNATVNATNAGRSFLRLVGLDTVYAGWMRAGTEHFRLLASPRLPPAGLERFLREQETAYSELQRFFAAGLPKKVDIILWSSREEAAQNGFPAIGFARPELALVHMRPGQSAGHELAHVLSFHAVRAPRNRTRLVNEGVAVLFDLNGTDRMTAARAVVDDCSSVDILDWWTAGSDVPEELLYPVAAAWMERLLARGGRDALLQLLRDQTLANGRRIYGKALDDWLREFSRELGC